ncbi:MAG: acylphosphatase, partial [Clostridia bacterium]|nr:acylphosphatase [Clostridia bacterium]
MVVTRLHLIFHGRVQHVGFRYTAYYCARQLYITGWVDNRPDGS